MLVMVNDGLPKVLFQEVPNANRGSDLGRHKRMMFVNVLFGTLIVAFMFYLVLGEALEGDLFLSLMIALCLIFFESTLAHSFFLEVKEIMMLSVDEQGLTLSHPILSFIKIEIPFTEMDRLEVGRGPMIERTMQSNFLWRGSPTSLVIHRRKGKKVKIGPRSPDTIIRAVNAIRSTGRVRLVDQGKGRGTVRRLIWGAAEDSLDAALFKRPVMSSPYTGKTIEVRVTVDDGTNKIRRGPDPMDRFGSLFIIGFSFILFGVACLGTLVMAFRVTSFMPWVQLGALLLMAVTVVLFRLMDNLIATHLAEATPLVVDKSGFDGYFYRGDSKTPRRRQGVWWTVSHITILRTPVNSAESGIEPREIINPLVLHLNDGSTLRTLDLDPDHARMVLDQVRSKRDVPISVRYIWREPVPDPEW